MKCVISGQNAAILAKVIHSFARIGVELYLDADTKLGLSLRTVNMTKSAFSSIQFNLEFFNSFVVKARNPDENQCKLSMKSCVGVFRNMKQVETCMMKLDTKAAKLTIQFKCRLETIKTHHIAILEQESLQAAYCPDRTLNVLGGNHKLFSNIVANFKTNEEELCIKASKRHIVLQNYADGTHVDNRFVRSQITVRPEEFESYKIDEETIITFCMRELRAILSFAESMNISMSANFDTAGKPIIFVINDFNTFEANLVMSTLSPDYEDSQQGQSVAQINSQVTHASIDDGSRVNGDVEQENQVNSSQSHSEESTSLRKRNISKVDDNEFEFGRRRSACLDVLRKKPRTSQEKKRQTNLPVANETDRTEISPPKEMQNENIEVIFQDESPPCDIFPHSKDVDSVALEPMEYQPNENLLRENLLSENLLSANLLSENLLCQNPMNENQRNGRDHRADIRRMFPSCFTGLALPNSYGETLVDPSDEE